MTRLSGSAVFGAALCICLAACVPEGLFDFEVSSAAKGEDWPALYAGGPSPQVLPQDADQAAPLQEASDALARRAAALRARAAAMAGPVLAADDPARQAFGG